MLRVYDQNHNQLGMLVRYKNLKIKTDLDTGDKDMSFDIIGVPDVAIEPEYYIRTQHDEFVVKKAKVQTGKASSYECILNLEELEGTPFTTFSIADKSIRYGVEQAIAGTGWTLGECEIPDGVTRNAGMIDCNAITVIDNLCAVWMCEKKYDSLNKVVHILKAVGSYKGAYLATGLNLIGLDKESDSYDFYTRLVPIGADGLTIEAVNAGKNYVENHSYSNKVKTYIWRDESYTDAAALKEDAEEYLKELAEPKKTMRCKVVDLAKQSSRYSILKYSAGDTVLIIDPETRTREKQRITSTTEYPQSPWKNECDIASRQTRFTEMQERVKKAEEISSYITDADGRYAGTVTLSQILKDLKK